MADKNLTDTGTSHTPRDKLDASTLSVPMQQNLTRLTRSQGVFLINGSNGSGKILAAEVIAGRQNTNLLKVDTAKLLSKYIGETEKNIDKLLLRAEEKKAVLFFDEADSLFSKRTSVKDSHDRYANQEVSYLLKKLEGYKGLAILSTNLKPDIARQLGKRFTLVVLDDDD